MAELKRKLCTPYGMAGFALLREHGCAYADKTWVIERLEALDSTFVHWVRPRRFGKSLLMTTLKAYYDRHAAEHFDERFAGTYIHEHRTPLASQYFVLSLDFSGMGHSPDLTASLMNMVRCHVRDFFWRYPLAGWEAVADATYLTPADQIVAFLQFVAPRVKGKLCLIIDEYDQFANALLVADQVRVKEAQGLLQAFYKRLREAAGGCIARVFVTGVLPVAIDGLTSGAGELADCTMRPAFSDALGFTDSELRRLIDDTIDFEACGLTAESIFQRMKVLYGGYRFSPSSDKVVSNSIACLNYLRAIRDENAEPEGDDLIDTAFEGNVQRIQILLALGEKGAADRLVDAVAKGCPLRLPTPGLFPTIALNKDGRLDEKALLSTFFYFGFLTWAPGTEQALTCPNQMVRDQFLELSKAA